jgi:hypothetical protein
VLRGVAAPRNLQTPPDHYPNDKTLRIGENPEGAGFDSVELV